MIDEKKLQQFLGKMIVDLGAAMSVPLVRIGIRLGLYKAMDGAGPMTSVEFADKANISERYAREWLAQNAASGYLSYDPASRRFELPPEQAMVFANEESPFFIGGGFDAVAALYQTQPLVEEAFKSGGGVDWGDHAGCLFCAIGAMLRPRYSANIVQNWLPALDGVVAKLERGAKVADIGCGTGQSTFIMARAFPKLNLCWLRLPRHRRLSTLPPTRGRVAAREHPVRGGQGKRFPARDLDLVTCFDVLHDLGDPVGAAAHIHRSLKPDGTWMLMEPLAGDATEDNLGPVGRVAYAFSTMACVPVSLSQEVGMALGAQAGQTKLTEVIKAGGFSQVRRAAETQLNMVLEARP